MKIWSAWPSSRLQLPPACGGLRRAVQPHQPQRCERCSSLRPSYGRSKFATSRFNASRSSRYIARSAQPSPMRSWRCRLPSPQSLWASAKQHAGMVKILCRGKRRKLLRAVRSRSLAREARLCVEMVAIVQRILLTFVLVPPGRSLFKKIAEWLEASSTPLGRKRSRWISKPLLGQQSGGISRLYAIGASAGGLDACRKLLDALPAVNGMAFIIVQHLDPSHDSMMVDLLAGHTAMPVLQAADGMADRMQRLVALPFPPASICLSDDKGAVRISKPQCAFVVDKQDRRRGEWGA